MEGGLFPMRDTARRVSALRRLNGAVEQMQWDGQINSREAEGFRRYIQYLRSFSPEPVTPPIRLSLSEPARVFFPVESGRPTGPILCESAREMDEIQVLGDDRVQQKFEEERVDASGQTDPHNESAGDFPANEVVQTYKTQYPSGSAFIFILIGLCLSVFCLALDKTIVGTAIPRITDQFKVLGDVGWYGSAYLLTTCAFQLTFGKLYTFYPIKLVYLSALIVFEIGSLICAITPTSIGLIVGRAVAGIGSAGLFSGSFVIISHIAPLEQRPMYTGLIGAMFGIASVAGPILGGVFTDRLTWRWCFYINLPFGGVTAIFLVLFFTSPGKPATSTTTWRQQLKHFDIYGTVCILGAVVCLLLALQWGGSKYVWNGWQIILLICACAVFTALFVKVQLWRQEMATVPPRIFKKRAMWTSAWFSLCIGGAFFNLLYYIPIWFQAIKGASSVRSGIMLLPLIMGQVVMVIVSGGLVSKIGYYAPFLLASTTLMSIGAGIITTFEVNTSSGKWIAYQLIFGLGIGTGFQMPLIGAQTCLAPSEVPIGTAIMVFAQSIGGALFVSVGQNIFTNKLIQNLGQVVPQLNSEVVLNTGATDISGIVPSQLLPEVLIAYNGAITDALYTGVAMAVLSAFGAAFTEWRNMKT